MSFLEGVGGGWVDFRGIMKLVLARKEGGTLWEGMGGLSFSTFSHQLTLIRTPSSCGRKALVR